MTFYDRRQDAITHELAQPKGGVYSAGAKRLFDLFVVLLLLVPVSIVVLSLAAIIALDGKSPFYRQKRVGLAGREFSMLKLRSMVPCADQQLAAYLEDNPDAREEWELKQKLTHDPRITPIGHVIRKTSLDELPQLWNVLIGDMSIVGPRPMMVSQKSIYPGTAYYEMRPGITGYWQISERNAASFAQRAFYDNQYYIERSFISDLNVILRTAGVVLAGTGR